MSGVPKGNKTFKRFSLNLPEELDRVVLNLRMTEKYCRYSYGEIIRILMAEGAKVLADRHQDSDVKE